jgi:hypothetical protein
MTMLRTASIIVATFMLAGCAGGQFTLGETKPAAPPAPKIDMAGRWMLATPNAPACGMRFNGAAGAREGTIAPEGGCPGNFFTSRHWAFESNELVIRDHNSEPLANLTFESGKFDGKAATGTPVTLSR